ncbi:IclR family transcriptional regulator domain-containing protein [Microbacterium elymi]|uniref:Helix-turn-helix domain-containing protein n=1 Tax=Microbacterium elymi TaxID=2909587 RepID=A0ABY5NMD8_9MICO|nr:IclR family transcriptional regulator C-terminal domain-containing protein [Microbacterium elymi]UUT36221.1 helix-turn-helix domain-containing protein [Microbacterium elymi]
MTAERTERSRDRVQSIERGIAVLRVFDGRSAPLSASDIAARAGLPRPVVRRILLTFEHLGYMRGQRGLWSLTPRILELGAAYFADSSLPEIARPAMDDVVAQLGETCSLGVLSGADVIHVARVEDHRPLPGAVRVGMSLPASATAVGKVLLAGLGEAALARALAEVDWEPHTPHTITDAAALRARIAQVRTQGYDVSIEELNPGMVAAAVPITVGGEAVGALGVSSTTVRQDEASLTRDVVPVLRVAADRIARGYLGANPHLYRPAP